MSKKNICKNCKYFNWMSRKCENLTVAKQIKPTTKSSKGFDVVGVSQNFGCIHFEKGSMDFRGYT
jgi:hypothetical protein